MTYVNSKGSHYAISTTCSAWRPTLSLAQSERDNWRMLEQERQEREEEEDASEKAKDAERTIQVRAIAEKNERSKLARWVTRDREDGNLRI